MSDTDGAGGESREPRELRAAYRSIKEESLPEQIELTFISAGKRETLRYSKVRWERGADAEGAGAGVEGAEGAGAAGAGLRYGENPEQRAGLYRLDNDTISIGDERVSTDALGQVTDSELVRSGKHPSKINITDLDCGLQLMRYMMDSPTAIIIKHNNPCAVASARSIFEACARAHASDLISSFGGVVTLNRGVDVATAEYIARHYFELVAAPEYEAGAIAILERRKNLRIVRVRAMDALPRQRAMPLIQLHTLSDLSLCLQDQYVSPVSAATLSPARVVREGTEYRARHAIDERRLSDCLFGWHVVESLWSNAVCFVRDGCTVGIGCGAVDRVGAVRNAIDKAYRNHRERYCQQHFRIAYDLADTGKQKEAEADAILNNGGLADSILCSDAFFPFADGPRLALRERVAAIVEPGGSVNDWRVIEACNAERTPLLFTAHRAFRH